MGRAWDPACHLDGNWMLIWCSSEMSSGDDSENPSMQSEHHGMGKHLISRLTAVRVHGAVVSLGFGNAPTACASE
eukprot:4605933-Amphidinium_carterae.1